MSTKEGAGAGRARGRSRVLVAGILLLASSAPFPATGHDSVDGVAGGHEAHQLHQAHEARTNVAAAQAPTLRVSLHRNTRGAYELRLATTRFRFSEAHAGRAHIAGEGHAHLYIDGQKVARVFGSTYALDAVDPGVHAVRAGLYTNDHSAYAVAGNPVADRMLVRLPEPDPDSAPGDVRRIAVAIRERRALLEEGSVRLREGDEVTLRLSIDEPGELHLHGYDLEASVGPQAPLAMYFVADLTGRFPIELHGADDHVTLLHLEIYPR